MISILKIGRTTFVLSNRQMGDSAVFEATILHREEEPVPPVKVPLLKPKKRVDNTEQTDRRYNPRPGGKKAHLEAAMSRIRNLREGSAIRKLCLSYEDEVRSNPPLGKTCHSSAWDHLVKSGVKPSNGHVYNLIAWAIHYCSLAVTDTYPMTYVRSVK